MGSKRFFGAMLLLTALFVALGEWACYRVDPVGVWGARTRNGLNNMKVQQGFFLDIFKPYEYARVRPDVVFLGTSRVHVGWDASSGPEPNAYNFAMTGLPLSTTESYLRFAYRVHTPKKVYLGLDAYSFHYDNYHLLGHNARPSFSEKRLAAIASGPFFSHVYAIKDSLSLMGEILPTVEASDREPEHPGLYERGWFRQHGGSSGVNEAFYYDVFNISNLETKDATGFRYAPEAMECLKRILADAEAHGVEMVLFFNPMSVDEHTMMYFGGQEPTMGRIKKDIALLHSVYDFDCLSPYTENIRGYYYDFLHYRKPMGDAIHKAMFDGRPEGIGRLLTAENADAVIREEQQRYEDWRQGNPARVEALRFYFDRQEKAPKGAFKEFIGF